jgi:hypothetical protein
MENETKPTSTETPISKKFIDQFYTMDHGFKDQDGKDLEIPEHGFLGLLAIGYRGLSAWRVKKGTTYLYDKFTWGKSLKKRPKVRRPGRRRVKKKE